ncbi:MAG: hypothetical protein WD873_06920 [Candidatus Hydrogenedentales bacterium]
MQFPASVFLRSDLLASAAVGVLLYGAEARAQQFELTVTPIGSAASGRPLPVGAVPAVKISLRNTGNKSVGPIELTARFDELAPSKTEGWRLEERTLRSAITEVSSNTQIERELRLRVVNAPIETAKVKVAVEAKGPDGRVVSGVTELSIADCAGAYRAKLESLRPTLSQAARDAANELRRSDPALPAARQFPPTGARSGDLARAERLAANFAARRGADSQMSTEWFRFLLQRWASELNAYAGQSANPGICANNYYQIAGYRQGLLPVTKHIEATRAAATATLEAARKEAAIDADSVEAIVRHLAKSAELEINSENAGALVALAEARNLMRADRKVEVDTIRKFSLVETAAWLAEADRRGQKLVQSIEQVLSTIANAHKETCVCAF